MSNIKTTEVRDFYVKLNDAIITHQQARLNIFYLINFFDSKDYSNSSFEIIISNLDFSKLLEEGINRIDNEKLLEIKESLEDLICFIRNMIGKLNINKEDYLEMISLMQDVDRNVILFRKDISHSLAYIDDLTDLLNRAAMEKDLERYHEKFLNDKEIYSIALIDIDNFKMINDNYGHTFGDEVLKEISKKIKESIRRTDKVYRYGGEEILVCFRGKNVEQVFDIINRLRKKVGLHRDYNVDFNLEITFSAGVATPEVSDLTYIDVIDRADEKLYSAKKSGKNRVGF